jgi:hypothetical protein
MVGTCQFTFGQRSGVAAWSYDGLSLVVTPDGAGPLTFAVKELAGISGDDYTVQVVVPGAGAAGAGGAAGSTGAAAGLVVSHLGHDGPTLAESLRRDWLKARTDVLRLGGSGEGWLVLGQVVGLDIPTPPNGETPTSTGTPEPFRALLYEDVLVVAREGRDLEPVFLALLESVTFDESTYTVRAEEWPGRKLLLSRSAKQTDELVRRLTDNRSRLAQETATTLAAALPSLSVEGRSSLAGTWMPGRLMEVDRMELLCPGFEDGLRGGWVTGMLRREEGTFLLDWASTAGVWLGCTREEGRPLWMLAGKSGTWFLEPLSIEDHATYCFKGGAEVPALVSRLLCAPQFSKEALYSPLADLTGDNAELAIPAGCLGFLVQLRKLFQGRVIHQSVESWCEEVERLS